MELSYFTLMNIASCADLSISRYISKRKLRELVEDIEIDPTCIPKEKKIQLQSHDLRWKVVEALEKGEYYLFQDLWDQYYTKLEENGCDFAFNFLFSQLIQSKNITAFNFLFNFLNHNYSIDRELLLQLIEEYDGEQFRQILGDVTPDPSLQLLRQFARRGDQKLYREEMDNYLREEYDTNLLDFFIGFYANKDVVNWRLKNTSDREDTLLSMVEGAGRNLQYELITFLLQQAGDQEMIYHAISGIAASDTDDVEGTVRQFLNNIGRPNIKFQSLCT